MKRWFLLLVCLMTAVPLTAQDDRLPREAVLAAAQQRLGTRAQSWTYTILAPTRSATLGCPSAPAGDLGREVIPYRYVLRYATGEYVVFASSDGTVVVLCDDKFNLTIDVPTAVPPEAVPVLTQPAPSGDGCLLSTTGAFANVRANPSREAAQVAQIFSGQSYVVLAQSSRPDDRWYFIPAGWVSATVATVTGAGCAALPVDDGRVGSGAGVTVPTTDMNIAQTLALYACPPGFEGYMPPRLQIGPATARVGAGGLPNVIRSQPIVNDSIGARLGTIQPSRTIDQVINGPACSGGYVWWLVRVDNVQGWTAESDFAQRAYFLEPLTQAPATATPAPLSQLGRVLGRGVALQQRDDITGAARVGISADGLFGLVSGQITIGEGQAIFVVAEYALDAATPRFTDTGMALPSAVTGIQVLADGRVAVSDQASLFIFRKQGNDYLQDVVIPNVIVDEALQGWALTPDGRLLVSLRRGSGVEVVMRSITSPDPLWIAELPFDAFKLAFSPDQQSVAAFGFDGVVILDSITGIQQAVLSNATEQFGMLDFTFDPTDSNRLLTTICKRVDATRNPPPCVAGEVTLWSINPTSILGVVETNSANPLHLVVTADASLILVGDAAGRIVVLDGGGNLVEEVQVTASRDEAIVDMALGADDRALVLTTSSGQILWLTLADR
jgi:hypothetical protein